MIKKKEILAETKRKVSVAEALARGDSISSVEKTYHVGFHTVKKIADEFGVKIKTGNPKRVVTPEDIELMESMARAGKSFAEICKATGKKSGTLWRYWTRIQAKLGDEHRGDEQPAEQTDCVPMKQEKLLMDALSHVYDALSAVMADLQMDMNWFKEQQRKFNEEENK